MSNNHFPPALETLIEHFARLPGVGRKSAQRLALHMLAQPPAEVEKFANALQDAKNSIACCPQCQNLTQGGQLCGICLNTKRDATTICVVADPKDVMALERSHEYQGHYHVLHGVISPMSQVGPDQLRIKELVKRAEKGDIHEVIMATNPDVEGDMTAAYLSHELQPYVPKITRLAFGVPVGSHLEHTDDATLMRALEGRRELFSRTP